MIIALVHHLGDDWHQAEISPHVAWSDTQSS